MKNRIGIVLLFYVTMLNGQDWHKSFDEAQAEAKKNNKPIVLVFSGSDWCAPCIKLDKEIWQSDEFKKYALGHYVLYKADFPRKKTISLRIKKQRKIKF